MTFFSNLSKEVKYSGSHKSESNSERCCAPDKERTRHPRIRGGDVYAVNAAVNFVNTQDYRDYYACGPGLADG
jgi:hypothetical protein